MFNLCGFFFAILCFCCLFVFFVILALFFCWFWGTGLTVSFALLFIVICLFFFFFLIYFYFIYFFLFLFFFYLHGFSGFIFCKFDCSWHFFTSSDRVSPVGGSAREPRFADWYRGVVSYTNDDFGKWVAWLTWNWWNGTEETVDDGLGRRYLGAGRCPVAPPHWLVMAGRSGRWCQLLCFFLFLSFENPWWLMAERLVLFVAGGSEGPQVGKWIPQCFLEHYSCYDTDRTAEITDAPTS